MRSMASGRSFRCVWNRKKAVSHRRTRIAEDDVSVKKNDHLRVKIIVKMYLIENKEVTLLVKVNR